MAGVELQKNGIGAMPIVVVALAVSAKSPPGLFQGTVSKKLCVHVAVVPSAVGGYPWLLSAPPFPLPLPPSPQSANNPGSWVLAGQIPLPGTSQATRTESRTALICGPAG